MQNAADASPAVRWLCFVEFVGHGGDRADQHQHRGRDGRGSHRIPGPVSERALLLPGVLQTGVDLIQPDRCARALFLVSERKYECVYGIHNFTKNYIHTFIFIKMN